MITIKSVKECPMCKIQSYHVTMTEKDVSGECILCGYKKQIIKK